jgi:hypothetical protein
MPTSRRTTRIPWYSLVALLMIGGCGGGASDAPPRAAVKGTVHLDDAPLAEGIIRFVPTGETTGPKVSAPIVNGEFSLPVKWGPWVGAQRVEIESTDDGGLAPDDETAVERMREAGIRRVERVEIPAIYNRRSTLTTTILAEQENELEFKLSSAPSRR